MELALGGPFHHMLMLPFHLVMIAFDRSEDFKIGSLAWVSCGTDFLFLSKYEYR